MIKTKKMCMQRSRLSAGAHLEKCCIVLVLVCSTFKSRGSRFWWSPSLRVSGIYSAIATAPWCRARERGRIVRTVAHYAKGTCDQRSDKARSKYPIHRGGVSKEKWIPKDGATMVVLAFVLFGSKPAGTNNVLRNCPLLPLFLPTMEFTLGFDTWKGSRTAPTCGRKSCSFRD